MKTSVILMGDRVLGAANVTLLLIKGNTTFQLEMREIKDKFSPPSKFIDSSEFYLLLGIHGLQFKSLYVNQILKKKKEPLC